MSIGERIKHLRQEAGITQLVLAHRVGVSELTIGHWEKGRRQPSARSIVALARALRADPGILLGSLEPSTRPRRITSPDTIKLVELFESLPGDTQHKALDLLAAMLDAIGGKYSDGQGPGRGDDATDGPARSLSGAYQK